MRDAKGRFVKGHKPDERWKKNWSKKIKQKFKEDEEYRKKILEASRKGADNNKGANNVNWKGGVKIVHGYRYLLRPEHPYAQKSGYVPEQRLVMEKKVGRYIQKDEVVHHINGVKDDNRIENLVLLKRSRHMQNHYPKGSKFGVHTKERRMED